MFKVYFSHSIRGKSGSDATPEEQRKNCQAAINMADAIRKKCPWLELYVPAENEEFVGFTFKYAYLTEAQILEIDCMIADEYNDAMLILIPVGDELQGGRLYEFNHAIDNCIPTCRYCDAESAVAFLTELYNYKKGETSTGYGGNADE